MPRMSGAARRALVEERQTQILTAAARVFAAKGFDRATIRDVARAAGLAEGSIYNYFHDKQDLLVHLPRVFIQPRIEALKARTSAAGAGDGARERLPDPTEMLSGLAQNIVEVVTQNREIARILFTTLPIMDAETRGEYMREVPAYAFEALEAYLRAQQAAGRFRTDVDAAVAARMFPGVVMFYLMIQEVLQPAGWPRIEYDKVVPTMVDVFLHGLEKKE